MVGIQEGTLLWEPTSEWKNRSNMARYMRWLAEKRGLSFSEYEELWEWSVTDLESFWSSLWEFFGIQAHTPYERVLLDSRMPGAKWFAGATLNYAEHVFRNMRPEEAAILHASELRPLGRISWSELYEKVSALAAGLKELGVKSGDRVVAYVPNIPEAVIAFLACASIGAIWSGCSPDFGSPSVIDRFRQIQPKVLFAVDGYRYGGKDYDRMEVVESIQREIPTVETTLVIPYLNPRPETGSLRRAVLWEKLLSDHQGASLSFEPVPFDHPLWVLYSSGTTGIPKAIVQGQGGILLEHLKLEALHMDVRPGDRFFWFTTTGWMMWNVVVSGLLTGASILLYDGNPGYLDLNVLWRFAEQTEMTHFGTSAAYLTACMKAGLRPGQAFKLDKLRAIGSTGSPLSPGGFQWVYEHVKKDLWLASASGGTDVCAAFVGGSPLLPVRAGEIQCRVLGAAVHAFDEEGSPVTDEIGELVVTKPMPSMPLFFWNDPQDERYRKSYFDMYPGVWRHGDWIRITPRGSCVIYGRSDSTLNRGGVRIGTGEIYSAVEEIPEVLDSLVLDIQKGDGSFMALFVVLKDGNRLEERLKQRIKDKIRSSCSPRHVPDDIFVAPDIPKTLNGKKLEVPIKKIFMGVPVEKAVNVDAMSNPESLEFFLALSKEFSRR